MVFLGFIPIPSIFFLFAAISGNVNHFINLDSLLILVVAGLPLLHLHLSLGRAFGGLQIHVRLSENRLLSGSILMGSSICSENSRVAARFKSLIVVTVAVGVVSTMQGLISYALAIRDGEQLALELPLGEALCYAGFTTVYALMLSFFLYYPVYCLNKKTTHRAE